MVALFVCVCARAHACACVYLHATVVIILILGKWLQPFYKEFELVKVIESSHICKIGSLCGKKRMSLYLPVLMAYDQVCT